MLADSKTDASGNFSVDEAPRRLTAPDRSTKRRNGVKGFTRAANLNRLTQVTLVVGHSQWRTLRAHYQLREYRQSRHPITNDSKGEQEMKDQPTVFGTTSRRQFTRAAAAALIAAPLIRAAGGQRTAPRSRKSKSMRLPPPPRVHGFTRMLSPGVEEHIPPMTLTDGSLEINCYDRFDNDNGVQIGASTWR